METQKGISGVAMQLFQNLADVHLSQPTVLTIGTFDGLHRGHRDVINQLKAAAQMHGAKTAVMAFHPRPKAVFAPQRFKNDYLTTPTERVSLFKQLEIDVLILIPFTFELAQTPAFDFMQQLTRNINLVQLCVGHDFALGKNREGTIDRLAEIGNELNYSVGEIKPFTLDGTIVSSTQVRKHLLTGDVRKAAYLLGRYPSFESYIIEGDKRGRTIGFPTANFSVPTERLLPENGVYATFFQYEGNKYSSVTNIGIRPTFDGTGSRTVEAHIFNFDQDIYGQPATLEFVERLRPEKKFSGIDALIAQITKDAETAETLLALEQTIFGKSK